mmetsp:Transcript_12209/g.25012  ORF Transcript_12209/g.25012 Transcript_12209/m.25012 type:complete len:85 (-) Transcript_12209:98-352(-)
MSQRSSTYNPIKLVSIMSKMVKRQKGLGVSGNLKGEGLLQGGILVCDSRGGIEYIYYEKTFSTIPAKEIRQAMNSVLRRENYLG